MSVKVCPKCGGEIVSGVCFSCGHHPEEGEALSDFVNPYAETKTAVPEIVSRYAGEPLTAETTTAVPEIVSPYPSEAVTSVPDFVNPYAKAAEAEAKKETVPEIPDIAEIPSIALPDIPASPTAKLHTPVKRKTKEEKAAEKAEKAKQQYEKKDFVPYTKPVYGNSQRNEYTPEDAVKVVSDFVFHHWWKLLLVALVPTAGLAFGFFYIVINRIGDTDSKTSERVLAVMMFILTALLWVANWDPLGIDYILKYFIFS